MPPTAETNGNGFDWVSDVCVNRGRFNVLRTAGAFAIWKIIIVQSSSASTVTDFELMPMSLHWFIRIVQAYRAARIRVFRKQSQLIFTYYLDIEPTAAHDP